METIQCQSCRRRLQIDEEFDDLWLTCPHCLTMIMNPNRVDDFRPRRINVSRPDTEAKADMTVTVVCLVFFGVILLMGLLLLFSGDALQLLIATESGITILVMIVLFMLIIVGGTVSLILLGKESVTKILATLMGTVGLGLVSVVFVAALICAGLANLFQTCASCGNAPPPQKSKR